ncbi:MAG: tetratricopeptide repeat protein [Opitutae bacterium]|nr:tetratricopeptide repeat protein [Opitutae bacterium]
MLPTPLSSPDRLTAIRAALGRGWETLIKDPLFALAQVDETRRLLDESATEPEVVNELALLHGSVLASLGRNVEARTALQPLLAADAPPSRPRLAARIALGMAELRLGHDEAALAQLHRAIEQADALGDLPMEGFAQLYAGVAHNERGRHVEAVTRLTTALSHFIACGDRFGIAATRAQLGHTHFALGQYAQAADYFLAGLRTWRELGNRRGLADGWSALGRVYLKLGDHEKSVESYRQAIAEYNTLGLAPEEAVSWGELAQARLQSDALAEAAGALGQALALAERHELTAQLGAMLFSLGEVSARQGRSEFAAAAFVRALTLTATPEHHPARAAGLLALVRAREIAPTAAAWSALPTTVAALEEAVQLSVERELPAVEREARGRLAAWCERQGDLAGTLHHRREHDRLQEAFWQEKAKQAVARAEVYYALERHRREAELAQAHAHELEAALNEAQRQRERAETESHLKSELLGIVAHDLRNALSQIGLAAECLRAGTTDPGQLENCGYIAIATRRAERLIRSLLDRAALEEGRLALQPTMIDLTLPARVVWQQSASVAARKDQRLDLAAAGPVWAFADAQRVEQVLQNLVDNAIKFTPRGRTISLAVHAEGATARLSVHDEGLGMSAEDLARAFERFTRLSARPTGDEPSTGLGLSITKQLVEAMNGRVWVESAGKGCGCTFHVTLPTQPPG